MGRWGGGEVGRWGGGEVGRWEEKYTVITALSAITCKVRGEDTRPRLPAVEKLLTTRGRQVDE